MAFWSASGMEQTLLSRQRFVSLRLLDDRQNSIFAKEDHLLVFVLDLLPGAATVEHPLAHGDAHRHALRAVLHQAARVIKASGQPPNIASAIQSLCTEGRRAPKSR